MARLARLINRRREGGGGWKEEECLFLLTLPLLAEAEKRMHGGRGRRGKWCQSVQNAKNWEEKCQKWALNWRGKGTTKKKTSSLEKIVSKFKNKI